MAISLDWNIKGLSKDGVKRGDYCEAIAMEWIRSRWPHSQILDTRVGPHGIDFAVLLPNTMDGRLLVIVEVKAAKSRLSKAKGNTPAQMSEQWILERVRKHQKLRSEAAKCTYAFKEIIRVNPEIKKNSLMKHTGEKIDLSEFKE